MSGGRHCQFWTPPGRPVDHHLPGRQRGSVVITRTHANLPTGSSVKILLIDSDGQSYHHHLRALLLEMRSDVVADGLSFLLNGELHCTAISISTGADQLVGFHVAAAYLKKDINDERSM